MIQTNKNNIGGTFLYVKAERANYVVRDPVGSALQLLGMMTGDDQSPA